MSTRVTGRVWIAVRVPCLNGGDRSPVVVMVLGVHHGNVAVRKSHVEQPEQPRVLPELRPPSSETVLATRFHFSGELSTRRERSRFGRRCVRWEW